jgi:hypothetical protein
MDNTVVDSALESTTACWELLNTVNTNIAAFEESGGVSAQLSRPDAVPHVLEMMDFTIDWPAGLAGTAADGFELDWTYPFTENWSQPLPGTFL